MTPLLTIRNLTVRFGGVVALDDVSFNVEEGQIVGLIGPNGAGKTTLFNCLSRFCTPDQGEILFEGRSILQMPSYRIAGLGIGRTFQNLALFPTMTVLQNIMVGLHSLTRGGFFSNALRLSQDGYEEHKIQDIALKLVSFLDLDSIANHPAAGLPYGTLKRVELARALASKPKLLLLDEPAGGLNHEEVTALGRLIRDIRTHQQVTVLLVEHHMNLVMGISDRVVVLDFGRKLAEGSPGEIQQNLEVIRAYLGDVNP
jgi:branched-chain amino acid transport system ATP-binding protein